MKHLFKTPIEMPRGSHYGSDYWICQSYKIKRRVHMYSMLEFWNFITLEMDSSVEYFCEQPFEIEIHDEKSEKIRKSVFDFWVLYTDGREEFQEVKYSSEITKKNDTPKAIRSKKQIQLQKSWCDINQKNYVVKTEKDLLLGEFYISNLELLHHYMIRSSCFQVNNSKKLLNELYTCNLTISDIISNEIIPSEEIMPVLAMEYYKGTIDLNLLNRPIDNRTEVSLCEKRSLI